MFQKQKCLRYVDILNIVLTMQIFIMNEIKDSLRKIYTMLHKYAFCLRKPYNNFRSVFFLKNGYIVIQHNFTHI